MLYIKIENANTIRMRTIARKKARYLSPSDAVIKATSFLDHLRPFKSYKGLTYTSIQNSI